MILFLKIQELEQIKARVRQMEEEAAKLKQMQSEVDKQMTSPGGSAAALNMSYEEKVSFCLVPKTLSDIRASTVLLYKSL